MIWQQKRVARGNTGPNNSRKKGKKKGEKRRAWVGKGKERCFGDVALAKKEREGEKHGAGRRNNKIRKEDIDIRVRL